MIEKESTGEWPKSHVQEKAPIKFCWEVYNKKCNIYVTLDSTILDIIS